jgi:hypothetical protein
MDLEVQEAILAEDHVHDLHPPDGWNMLAELEETRAHVDEIKGEHAAEAEQLSQLVVGISNALVDLGMLPVQDNPQLLKSAREVLTVLALILERLREAHASSAGPCPCLWAVSPTIFPFLLSFSPQSDCNIHFHIHIYIYKDIGKLVSLHS